MKDIELSASLDVFCKLNTVVKFIHLGLQTMGGDFSSKGKQDCSKGIYVLAGLFSFCCVCCVFNTLMYFSSFLSL